jgi:hypothetical protein
MERGLTGAAVEAATAASRGGLAERTAELAGRYEEVATQADAAAVRWRWATPTSGHGDVEPLRLERMGCSRGRWLHRPPPPWIEHEAIGFDALGRVVCVRQYDTTGEVWLERFAAWERNGVEVACFRPPLEWDDGQLPAELQWLTVIRLVGGRPVESERYLPPTGSSSRERYRHEGGRLARVEEEACDQENGLVLVVKEVVYGEDGRVAGIDAVGPSGRRAVWRRGEQPAPVRTEARLPAPVRLRRQVRA